MADTNEPTIRRFYDAFARLDAATMQACYASDARFEDEVFTLRGAQPTSVPCGACCAAIPKPIPRRAKHGT